MREVGEYLEREWSGGKGMHENLKEMENKRDIGKYRNGERKRKEEKKMGYKM